MQATKHEIPTPEREIPIVYGSDLIQTATGQNNHAWFFPGPFRGQKAPYILVIELNSTTAAELESILVGLSLGRDKHNCVQVVLVASGETNNAREFVNETLKNAGVANRVHFVLWDDIDRTKYKQSILEVFWPLYQGRDKGQKKLFMGTSKHQTYGASQIGMPAITRDVLRTATSPDSYFGHKICPLIDGKPDYPNAEHLQNMEKWGFNITKLPVTTLHRSEPQHQSEEEWGEDIIKPIESKSKALIPWVFSTFFPSIANIFSVDDPFNDNRQTNFWFFLKVTLLKAFPFDGYNIATNEITSADGQTKSYRSERLPLGLMLASFFGLPTRVDSVIGGVPYLSGWQLLKNFFGGLVLFPKPRRFEDSKLRNRFEKRAWQIAAIPFKILIIFPLKIILIPFKTALNILKLFTEILPALLNYGMIYLTYYTSLLADKIFKTDNPIEFQPVFYLVEFFRYIAVFLTIVLTLSFAAVQYATMLLNRVGLALTSPARSAELAFALGRSIEFTILGETFGTVISYVFGAIGTILSLTLSAVLWTMLLPLTLGAIGTLIPSVTSAITWVSQLPFVTATLSWFSSLPGVSGAGILVNQLFATVGAALVAAFGPAVTALATLTMVQVPAAVLVVGTTLGLLVPPVAALLSIAADKLSDFWARWMWKEGGPFTWLFSGCALGKSSVSSDKDQDRYELVEQKSFFPGGGARATVGQSQKSLSDSAKQLGFTDRAADGVGSEPRQTVAHGQPLHTAPSSHESGRQMGGYGYVFSDDFN